MLHILGIATKLHVLWSTWAMGTYAEATTEMHMVYCRSPQQACKSQRLRQDSSASSRSRSCYPCTGSQIQYT